MKLAEIKKMFAPGQRWRGTNVFMEREPVELRVCRTDRSFLVVNFVREETGDRLPFRRYIRWPRLQDVIFAGPGCLKFRHEAGSPTIELTQIAEETAPQRHFEIHVTETSLYGVTYRVIAPTVEEAIKMVIDGPTPEQNKAHAHVEINRDFSEAEIISIHSIRDENGQPVPFVDPLNQDEEEEE
jgi:hypothetical protein